ncbi:hypothetical protein [Kitasatospora sp. HPMI-4]|uniref:hypothetical protein n=1 Tax=Kitasatospora sp. HPMI-4 TaxID=3448443 RepID=UPI003F1A95BF
MPANIVHANPATGLPVGTVAVFLTQGAALVALYPSGGSTGHGCPTFKWLCLGCGEASYYEDERGPVRNRANGHATDCRAIPWPRPAQL